MAKLDKTQPYGEVSGAMEDGTRYFQDDRRFDVHGNEIVTGSPAKAPAKAKAGKAAVATPDTDEQLAEQLKDLT